MLRKFLFICSIAIFSFLGCSSENPATNLPPNGQYFTVQVAADQFVMYVTDTNSIRLATENFHGKNNAFPSGRIIRGNGGFNQPWNWHFIPDSVRMVEVSIEVCDGTPSYVNNHLDDFVSIGYCPWGAKVVKIGK